MDTGARSSLACALRGRPCTYVHTLDVERQQDGTLVVLRGTPAPALCDTCPLHEQEQRPIRQLTIIHNYGEGDR